LAGSKKSADPTSKSVASLKFSSYHGNRYVVALDNERTVSIFKIHETGPYKSDLISKVSSIIVDVMMFIVEDIYVERN
jgi:hypothetical protein